MRWGSAASSLPRLEAAVHETAAVVHDMLGGAAPDLALVFVSPHHQQGFNQLPALVRDALAPRTLLGCSAGGVIGGSRELEEQPGVALTAAVLPDVTLTPLHLETPDAPLGAVGDASQFLLLPDPFSFEADALIRRLDEAAPGGTVLGGLASGGRAPGNNALFLNDATHRAGCVGVALGGNVAIDTIVAQGCRPIGEPMFVTRCERNVIHDLDGRRAAVVLQDLFARAKPRDQQLFRSSLFLGIAMREAREEYKQGDFLVRNVLGIEPRNGALVVSALVRTGMVVQLHLRDAQTSADDLNELLGGYHGRPHGALLFSCLGRGRALYGTPDHDTGVFRRHLGDVPLGGFFCNGEIGPVQGTTFLHGYTSAFGLFRPRT